MSDFNRLTLMSIITGFTAGAFVFIFLLWLFNGQKELTAAKGERGAAFKDAAAKWPLYKKAYVAVSLISVKIDKLLSGQIKVFLNDKLLRAGYPLGLGEADIITLSVFSAVLLSAAGAAASKIFTGFTAPGLVAGFITGVWVPFFKIDDIGTARVKKIVKEMPASVELISLGIFAGMDFHSAVKSVAAQMEADNPLKFEFEYLVNRLSLGSSRTEVLNGLAKRVNAIEIRRFVSSVILADKKGTPIAKILEIQAGVMRLRRSQAAERAAARASILMFGPLTLIFCSVFVLLLGPFIIQMAGGNFFS
jgi:tight adherence protein C